MHRQTGPRDIYANLLLFIDSRVPDENHLPRPSSCTIYRCYYHRPPTSVVYSYTNLRHSNPLGKQQNVG